MSNVLLFSSIDYENLKGDNTAKECKDQEHDTKVTATIEEVVFTTNPVLYCREEETCRAEQTVGLFIEKTNCSRSFPESVGSGKGEHHCSNAKKKGKKKWNKAKVQDSQKTEKLRKEAEESLEDNSKYHILFPNVFTCEQQRGINQSVYFICIPQEEIPLSGDQ